MLAGERIAHLHEPEGRELAAEVKRRAAKTTDVS